jgi:glycine reductase
VNLCLGLTVKEGASPLQYDAAVRLASLRAAVYLAGCTTGDVPCDAEEVLETGCLDPGLPNVAYINQIQSQGLLCRTFLYGMPVEGFFVPTLVDPNELMDGAIVSANYRNFMRACTYMQQNNTVVRTLYDRHGKDLNFMGMIVSRGHYDDQPSKTRSGSFAAKLAGFLKAHACVLTLEGTGNANVDFMATVKALELAGIAAAPIVHEFGGPGGEDEPLFDIAPQAVSIISGGGVERRFAMPAMDKVIGGDSVRFIYGDKGFISDDPRASRTATAHFYFCGYWTMQDKGFRAFDF